MSFRAWLSESSAAMPAFKLEDWPVACDWLEDDAALRGPEFQRWAINRVHSWYYDMEDWAEGHDGWRGDAFQAAHSAFHSVEFYWRSLVGRGFKNAKSLFEMMDYEIKNVVSGYVGGQVGEIDHENLIDPGEYSDMRHSEEEAQMPAWLREVEPRCRQMMDTLRQLAARAAPSFAA